jgi:hypothetical protein
MGFEQGRMELSFREERETTEDLEKRPGFEGTKVSLSVVATIIGGGVVKPGVGKYSKVLGLDHGTTSGEKGVTRISPSNPRP